MFIAKQSKNDNDLYLVCNRCIPREVLHTLVLGCCKYLLNIFFPKLSKQQKKEILARISAFSTSGFNHTIYGNVCQYYKSFVGRDFILGSDLNPAEIEVLLNFSKVCTCCVTVSYLIVSLLLAGI